MSPRRSRAPLWAAAFVCAAFAAAAALLLWRDGHVDHAREEVAAVLAPLALAALFALLAAGMLDNVTRAVVAAVQAWKGKQP